jgi:aspartate ammonia-lyase
MSGWTMDDPLPFLAESELFCGLDRSTLELVSRAIRYRELAAGELLFDAGDTRRAMFVVVEGTLAMLRERDHRKEQLILLGPKQVVGEGALLQRGQHSTTARATTRVRVIEFPRDEVLELLVHDAHAAVQLLTRVALTIGRRLQYSSRRGVGIAPTYQTAASREEHDLLGVRQVPADARFGVQTLRALENFPITGIPIAHFTPLVRALAAIKQAAARANARLKLLDAERAGAIERACQEVLDGHWHGHFVVDVVQGGAGTSTNMNANEVIANRALELLGHQPGQYEHCHPNNHVNLSQSTNDVYPSALRIAVLSEVQELLRALRKLRAALATKGHDFMDVLKMGRTQLQDAVPMTLGQEFTAFAVTTAEDIQRLEETSRLFLELNLGGTAIGTGINADPRYPELVVEELRGITGLHLSVAANLVEATPDTGAFVSFSGVLKRTAVKLSKMCNDLRLLSSGPRCGLNEINLPAMQPGSSIMPGKVNPVIPEMVNQVAFHVIGNDLAITLAAEAGQLQLNVMEPIIAFNLFQSMEMLTAAVETLTTRCIEGITANTERCREMVEHSIGIVTALVPAIGYDKASSVAVAALESGRPVREIVLEKGYLNEQELDAILTPDAMTSPRPLRRHDRNV